MLHEICALHACRYKWNLHNIMICAKVSACHHLNYACYMHKISYRVVYYAPIISTDGKTISCLFSPLLPVTKKQHEYHTYRRLLGDLCLELWVFLWGLDDLDLERFLDGDFLFGEKDLDRDLFIGLRDRTHLVPGSRECKSSVLYFLAGLLLWDCFLELLHTNNYTCNTHQLDVTFFHPVSGS